MPPGLFPPGLLSKQWGDAPTELEFELKVRRRRLEHRSANSRASIQHLPAALLGALKIRWEVGNGWTTAPMVSPPGPLDAQML